MQLNLIQVAFTRHGVRFRVLHNETMNIANIIAMGNAGAIIEVAARDFLLAKRILHQVGIQLDYPKEQDQFKSVSKFEKATNRLPWLGKLPLGKRYALVIGVFILLLTLSAMLSILRIDPAALPDKNITIKSIRFLNETLTANNTGIWKFGTPGGVIDYGRNYNVHFSHEGYLTIYGYSPGRAKGQWSLGKDKKTMTLAGFDELPEVFNGTYKVRHHWLGGITLVSDTTEIKMENL